MVGYNSQLAVLYNHLGREPHERLFGAGWPIGMPVSIFLFVLTEVRLPTLDMAASFPGTGP